MHELGITQNLIDIVSEYAGKNHVLKVKLEIGKLSAISAESICFCFEQCKQGTVLENAMLYIDIIEPRGSCESCGSEMLLGEPAWICACGSREIRCIAGLELKVKEIEIISNQPEG